MVQRTPTYEMSVSPVRVSHLSRERQAEALAVGLRQAGRGRPAPQAAVLQDGHAVTQRLRLIQVVGGEDERPTCGPRQGVKAGLTTAPGGPARPVLEASTGHTP